MEKLSRISEFFTMVVSKYLKACALELETLDEKSKSYDVGSGKKVTIRLDEEDGHSRLFINEKYIVGKMPLFLEDYHFVIITSTNEVYSSTVLCTDSTYERYIVKFVKNPVQLIENDDNNTEAAYALYDEEAINSEECEEFLSKFLLEMFPTHEKETKELFYMTN